MAQLAYVVVNVPSSNPAQTINLLSVLLPHIVSVCSHILYYFFAQVIGPWGQTEKGKKGVMASYVLLFFQPKSHRSLLSMSIPGIQHGRSCGMDETVLVVGS